MLAGMNKWKGRRQWGRKEGRDEGEGGRTKRKREGVKRRKRACAI